MTSTGRTEVVRYTEPDLREAARHTIAFAEGIIEGWRYAYATNHCGLEDYTKGLDSMRAVIDENLASLATPDCAGCDGCGQRMLVDHDPNGVDVSVDAFPCPCTGVRPTAVTL